jgi:hypothetical protein
MEMTPPEISVEPLGDEAAWRDFLETSINATLFHDLAFLGYHPAGRFRFHHLVFKCWDRTVALLPGGLIEADGSLQFVSPLGASVGGWAVHAGLRAETAVQLVGALQRHAREQNWGGVEITLPPPYYDFATAGLFEFALFSGGFRLVRRWLCPTLPIVPGVSFERTFRRCQRSYVRRLRRNGAVALEGGRELLDRFLEVFRDTYDRHGAQATHTPEEIADLLDRLPERVRIHLAGLGGEVAAGLLVLHVAPGTAYTFYICRSAHRASEHGVAFLVADLMERLPSRGVRYIDFGPSASDQKFNRGVTFFKEGLGAAGHCRDRWRWDNT